MLPVEIHTHIHVYIINIKEEQYIFQDCTKIKDDKLTATRDKDISSKA